MQIMSTDELKLSTPLVLKLREYKFDNDQMIAFALNLNRFFDVNKLAALMHVNDQISFHFDQSTQTFKLIDPDGLMGDVDKVICLKTN